MPVIRPFRALRYDLESVPDLARVVSPPYDVIDDGLRHRLLERDPRNVVRLDLPTSEPGEDPDERYRRAARTLAAWRSDGTLRKDPRAGLYAYEQAYVVPGTSVERTQRGFFGRLRLEPFGPGSGVLPHEHTLAAPREDRYRLLRATGVNTSPVVGLYADADGTAGAILDRVAAGKPEAEVRDDDGVTHRLWTLRDDGEPNGDVPALSRVAGAHPILIADGHHRYETALRYRDERRMSRSCEEDPPFDYLLMLFLDAARQPLTVLATHRIVLGLDAAAIDALWTRLGDLFDVRAGVPADRLVAEFEAAVLRPGGEGRFGLWTRGRGALLLARRSALERGTGAGKPALRDLDVTLLGDALGRLAGIDDDVVASGGRLAYTKSAADAVARVEGGSDGAAAAFLLEPTPVDAVAAVAGEGGVMPQKSTYFYPKALTGLVINPLEW